MFISFRSHRTRFERVPPASTHIIYKSEHAPCRALTADTSGNQLTPLKVTLEFSKLSIEKCYTEKTKYVHNTGNVRSGTYG